MICWRQFRASLSTTAKEASASHAAAQASASTTAQEASASSAKKSEFTLCLTLVRVRILGLENGEDAVDVVDLRHCVFLFFIFQP